MKRIGNITALCMAAIPVLLTACAQFGDIAYSDSRRISPECWRSDEILEFVPDSAVTCSRGVLYDIDLGVRHNEDYPYRDLRLAVQYESYDAPMRSDTLTIPMCDNRGRWLGSGSRLLYEVQLPLRNSVELPEGFTISISPVGGTECIPGVTDIVLTIRRHGSQK